MIRCLIVLLLCSNKFIPRKSYLKTPTNTEMLVHQRIINSNVQHQNAIGE